MFFMSAEEGTGLVSIDRALRRASQIQPDCTGKDQHPVSYRLETWLTIGGFKTMLGWIEGDPPMLQSLLPAAEVFLVAETGHVLQIEITDITDRRANVRQPRTGQDI